MQLTAPALSSLTTLWQLKVGLFRAAVSRHEEQLSLALVSAKKSSHLCREHFGLPGCVFLKLDDQLALPGSVYVPVLGLFACNRARLQKSSDSAKQWRIIAMSITQSDVHMNCNSARILLVIAAFASAVCPIGAWAQAPQAENYVELYAGIDAAVSAAKTALEQKRLKDAQVTKTLDGFDVKASLSGMAGFLSNSFGGVGYIYIKQAFPGSKRLRIGVTTQSNIKSEPVGLTDAIKGANFNDPRVAVSIVQSIKEQLPQSNVEMLAAEDEAARTAYEDGEKAKASTEMERIAELARLMANAQAAAAVGAHVGCPDEPKCKKAFSLAQVYISMKSDMKIQVATDTVIETYNPTEPGKVGIKIVKIPSVGATADIVMTVDCYKCLTSQIMDSLRIQKDFKQFVDSRL